MTGTAGGYLTVVSLIIVTNKSPVCYKKRLRLQGKLPTIFSIIYKLSRVKVLITD